MSTKCFYSLVWLSLLPGALFAAADMDVSKLPPAAARPVDFARDIQPIFTASCLTCHGPEKQKGGYRLDKAEFALKGGESGNPGIKPGDPAESHVVKLILLPTSHDDAMPPEGKQPLTSEEIMTIIDWIRNGAVFPEAGQALKATNTAG